MKPTDITQVILATVKPLFEEQTKMFRQIFGKQGRSRSRAASARSEPAEDDEVPPSRTQPPKRTAMSYAEALATAQTMPTATRIVTFVGPTAAQARRTFNDDKALFDLGVTSTTSKSANAVTIRCASTDAAIQIENAIKTSYGDQIQIAGVVERMPEMKIINIPHNIDEEHLIEHIQSQNHFLAEHQLQLSRVYETKNGERTTRNIIISCSLDAQKLLLENGGIMIGMTRRRCYKSLNLLQCAKCQRYGHQSTTCRSAQRCRKCGEHRTGDCEKTPSQYSCCMCTDHNTNHGTSYSTNHCTSHDRCPVRIERVESLSLRFKKLDTSSRHNTHTPHTITALTTQTDKHHTLHIYTHNTTSIAGRTGPLRDSNQHSVRHRRDSGIVAPSWHHRRGAYPRHWLPN